MTENAEQDGLEPTMPQQVTIGDQDSNTKFIELKARILKLVELKKFDDVLALTRSLPEIYQKKGRIVFIVADCYYEMGDDLEALKHYVKYNELYPNGYAKNFALMGIVACLKNLELQEEAKYFLTLVDNEHEGKDKELEHSCHMLKKQALARSIIPKT